MGFDQFATRRQHRIQLAATGAVVGQAQLGAFARQRQEHLAGARQGALQAFELGQFAAQLLCKLTLQRLTFGLQLVEFGMPGGDARGLPRTLENWQIEADLQIDHVAEFASTPQVIDLPAPVRLPFRCRLANARLCLLRHRRIGLQLRMIAQLMLQRLDIDLPVRQAAIQWFTRRIADPALERGPRLLALLLQLVGALGEQRRFLARQDALDDLSATTSNTRPHNLGEQAVLCIQPVECLQLAFDGMADNPGLGSGLANIQRFYFTLGRGTLDSGARHFDTGTSLVTVGHVLHQSDHAHGHAVPIQAPALGAFDRYALHAEQQFRVGQLASRYGVAAGGLQLGSFGL